jgi:hyperosmotically inducible periplasmic protein
MSRTGLLLLMVAALAAGGCKGGDRSARGDGSNKALADRSNTAVNERDRSNAYPTPDDQMLNEQDTKLTQEIRQAITADDSLSAMAKNIKIITTNGQVTLRGPVKTGNEMMVIAAKARLIAGDRVDNQLEVVKAE